MNNRVDLSQLAVDRTGERKANRPASRRRLFSRYLLPALVMASFVGLLAWSARDSFLPRTSVTVVPVLSSRSQIQATDAPLFQAAGWIEPRPTPVIVSALVEGVIDRLVVVEGQDVKAGEPVAYLIDNEARLAVQQAEASLELQQAELAGATATAAAAKSVFDEPVQRQAELANAEAELAKVQTELNRLPFQIRAGQSRLRLAEKDAQSKATAVDAVAALSIHKAQSEVEVTSASIDEQQSQTKSLEAELVALKKRRDVLRRQLELKTDETRQLAEAQASVKSSVARVNQAKVALDLTRLNLDRMIIRAPMTGKVLALVARPGSKVMGLAPAAMPDSTTVVTLYDPDSLQVRADVRLEDVPRVFPRQSVRIETPAVQGAITGKVLVATSVADIQKNTLQVKVLIESPPPVIKPDMLVQVTFLAPPQKETPGATPPMQVLIPRSLVLGSGETSFVWVADLSASIARIRPIKLGTQAGELVEVIQGLAVGDRVIALGRESLSEGQRIRVTGEDGTLGKQSNTGSSTGSGNSEHGNHSG